MKCTFCKSKMTGETTNLDLRINDKLVVVENVPAYICHFCGEKVVSPKVVREVERLVRKKMKSRTVKRISVPVMHFRHATA